MTDTYKIRCTLLGHSLDVRGVGAGETEGGKEFLVSGSRDKTAKVWMATEMGNFDQFQACEGHTNFVSCVNVIPPNAKYPQGIVLTGGHDHTVLGFELGKAQPIFRLLGHKGTVCSIEHSADGIIVTGSWDMTAKLWLDGNNIATLHGHEAAVWAVGILPGGGQNVLTGSADKTIRLWNGDHIVRAYSGHTDCVRALVVVDSSRFLSASNDATVRLWSVAEGECVSVFYGHSNFIYSLALLPNGQDFVSCGEDRTLRIWKGAECKQTIHLPATSIWSVATTKRGDIVAGSSDGTVRVFTADPDRYACAEELTKFEEEVAATTIAAQQELGGLKVSQLPGPEALLAEGKSDGETKMVREGSQVSCYSWSKGGRKWNKIGDVVGASGATQNTSGKILYEGKEYDYVFSVDLDGTQTLKLPYNITEDPWFAAKRFLDKNELNPQFLDQVANFIITNTKGMELGTSNDSNYADPFTGGNRYVPGSSQGPAGGGRFDGLDPFTGSGAYRTQSAAQATPTSSQTSGTPSFPITNFLRFGQQPNSDGLKSKINQFSKETGTNLDDGTIDFLITTILDGQYTEEIHGLIQSLLEWPKDKVFPLLDLLRIGVFNDQFASSVVSQLPLFQQIVPSFLSQDSPANQMLTLRLLCNLFGKQTTLLMAHRGTIVTQVLNNLAKAKNNQIAAGTLFLNYSIVVTAKENPDPTWSGVENQTEILMAAVTLVDVLEDTEAVYRLLVALGNLLSGNPMAIQLFKGLSGESIAKSYQQSGGLPKVQQCAGEILALLQ